MHLVRMNKDQEKQGNCKSMRKCRNRDFLQASCTLRTFILCTSYELAEAMTIPNCHRCVVHDDPFRLSFSTLTLPAPAPVVCFVQICVVHIPPRVTPNQSQPISIWVTLLALDLQSHWQPLHCCPWLGFLALVPLAMAARDHITGSQLPCWKL